VNWQPFTEYRIPEEFIGVLGRKVCPWHTAIALVEFSISSNIIDINSGLRSKTDSVLSCMITKPMPSADNWKQAYADDKDTNFIIGRNKLDKTPLTEEEVRRVHASYREALR
jgi:hypothetical protein